MPQLETVHIVEGLGPGGDVGEGPLHASFEDQVLFPSCVLLPCQMYSLSRLDGSVWMRGCCRPRQTAKQRGGRSGTFCLAAHVPECWEERGPAYGTSWPLACRTTSRLARLCPLILNAFIKVLTSRQEQVSVTQSSNVPHSCRTDR